MLKLWVLCREFEDIGLENIPHYDLFEDKTQNKLSFPQLADELEPLPEMRDHYKEADIPLPKGYEMTSGHVVAHTYDANENVMDRAHANLKLDNRIYQVEFPGGKVMELTPNVIAEEMYAQCDDGNKYFFLDLLVDYCKDNKDISLSDQWISIQGRYC